MSKKRAVFCYYSTIYLLLAGMCFILEHFQMCVVRLEMENRLAALEQQRALQEASDHAQKEEWEERLRNAQQGEESTRREVQTLR